MSTSAPTSDRLIIAGKDYGSRLLVGTGKYKDLDETARAIEASGAEIVTIAVRRTNIGQNSDEPNILEVLPPDRYTILPNTAGCYDIDTAVRTCRLARELLDGHNLVKLEVLGDEKTLFPDVMATLKAAEILVKDGFEIMVYTNDDPIVARELEAIGCIAVMPLAAPIGSGSRHPQSAQHPHHRRECQSAGAGRCRRRHGLGRLRGDGTGLRRRAHEHRYCGREKSGAHGERHAQGD
jgi:thiazole synthase